MNAQAKTHYRKAFHSPYLSSADITEPTVLTLAYVRLEADKTKKTKDLLNTAYFVEKEIRKGEVLKPMVLNATNSKMIAAITDSPFLEDWQNVQIVVQVVKGIRFGRETVDGLRIGRVTHAQGQQQYDQKPFINQQSFENACNAVSSGTHTIEQILNKYSLSDQQINHLRSLQGGGHVDS